MRCTRAAGFPRLSWWRWLRGRSGDFLAAFEPVPERSDAKNMSRSAGPRAGQRKLRVPMGNQKAGSPGTLGASILSGVSGLVGAVLCRSNRLADALNLCVRQVPSTSTTRRTSLDLCAVEGRWDRDAKMGVRREPFGRLRAFSLVRSVSFTFHPYDSNPFHLHFPVVRAPAPRWLGALCDVLRTSLFTR